MHSIRALIALIFIRFTDKFLLQTYNRNSFCFIFLVSFIDDYLIRRNDHLCSVVRSLSNAHYEDEMCTIGDFVCILCDEILNGTAEFYQFSDWFYWPSDRVKLEKIRFI